jgi:hypothetical protein
VGEIEDLERRVWEGISTMLVGPRRIGKTGSADITGFDLQMGVDEAQRHLKDDGA